ncbi:hypothetical protein L1887_11699 [Cichorium endivia]|nr:hypothetical protein L1887_11699 [Cichorium endivia]
MMIGELLRSRRREHHTIISRETIKPSSPTPSSLHTYNLSSFDQLIDQKYVSVILFYQNNVNSNLSANDKVQEIKKSLSQSLTRYYPFAGRLCSPTTTYVDCNDEGVVFVEAQNDRELETFQHITEQDTNLEQLLPDGLDGTNIVGVQLNHFACGGMGVAVSMSHIIGDGCTLGSFVNYWASVSRYGSANHKEDTPDGDGIEAQQSVKKTPKASLGLLRIDSKHRSIQLIITTNQLNASRVRGLPFAKTPRVQDDAANNWEFWIFLHRKTIPVNGNFR